MSLNLHQSRVTLTPQFLPMLHNLQANILKFHGRHFAHHLFIQVRPDQSEEAKIWISNFAESKITSSFQQLGDAALKKIDKAFDGGTIFTLSLSNFGYKTLKISSSIQQDKTFNDGMHARAGFLGDKFDNWEETFYKKQLDILVIVADDDAGVAAAKSEQIINEISSFGSCLINQRGNVLKMAETNVGIEHFGYADGISQPMYLADEINHQSMPRTWNDETNLDMVLVEEKDGIENCYGSYFVFRKLEQNVKCFKIAEGDLPLDPTHPECKRLLPSVLDENGNDNDELSGAMIVGRFENSTPVTKKSNAITSDPDDKHLDNDFDYSNDLAGLKCPFHAHVRIVNPRKGNPTQDAAEIRSHRITRRAIPFDDNIPKRIPDDMITSITGEILDANQPTGKVGLLFQCYQSDIQTHFEELQGQWANTGIIDPAITSIGEDSLITQGNDNSRSIPKQWGKSDQSSPFKFSGFVTMRGGEYFYTPSIPFLRNLH